MLAHGENPVTRLVDLSHVIENGMITYKGFPAPLICDYMSREESRAKYEAGTEFQIGKIEMVANTGTYIDSPFHRYADGADISELELGRLVDIDCIVVRSSANSIGPESFSGLDFRGKGVLVHTGWDRHWRTDAYFENHPHLTLAAARHLAQGGAAIVGIDSLNIDSIATGARPVHTVLLGEGIPILEHMCNLGELPDAGFLLTAAPVAVRGMGSFPVRAFAAVAK
jgi:kynurenine formamidase